MTDPDQLDAEAEQEQRAAVLQAALAQSLSRSDNPSEVDEAAGHSNESLALTAHAAIVHRRATTLRQKIQVLTGKIDALQKQIDAKLDERNALGDPDSIAGSAANEEARAKEDEKMITKLSYRDDEYGQSEIQKKEADLKAHSEEAERRRKESDNAKATQATIDKELQKLADKKKDLENTREAL